MSEEKEKIYKKFTFSLTEAQLDWLRAKGDAGFCMAKILQKMIDAKMLEEKLAKKESKNA